MGGLCVRARKCIYRKVFTQSVTPSMSIAIYTYFSRTKTITSINQSYNEKNSGRSNRSETAPSAIGIVPRLPPLSKLVSKLLALSSKVLFVLSSVSVDWHLQLV